MLALSVFRRKEGIMRYPENLQQNKRKLEGALIISYMHRGEETDVPQDQVAERCRQVTSA